MGLESQVEWSLKRYNTNMDLELDPDPEFEDNIGLLVLKTIILKKKMTPVCEGIFKSDYLEQLWDITFIFEINIGLLILKMILLK